MNDPIAIEALLARMRDWLEQTAAAAETETEAEFPAGATPDGPGPVEAGPEVGLFRLVEEFTALRHEIKLETKGSRSLQEQVETLLPTLRGAIDQFRAVGPREEQAVVTAARPLAEAMADLDEALDRGRLEVAKARARASDTARALEADLEALHAGRPWFRRFGLRAYHEQVRGLLRQRGPEADSELLDALLEGYDLIGARLRRAMDAGQIQRIACVGHPVDPERMTVVEAVDAPDLEPGLVADEVRRGYTWRGRVLRFAEVRAVRSPTRWSDESEPEEEEYLEPEAQPDDFDESA